VRQRVACPVPNADVPGAEALLEGPVADSGVLVAGSVAEKRVEDERRIIEASLDCLVNGVERTCAACCIAIRVARGRVTTRKGTDWGLALAPAPRAGQQQDESNHHPSEMNAWIHGILDVPVVRRNEPL